MSPELRTWLLDCPTLTSVSTLALDADACGLIDLGDAIAAAVSADVRLQTLRLPAAARRIPMRWSHRLLSKRPRLRAQLVSGTVTISGFIDDRALISQHGDDATLYLAAPIPDTIAAASIDRPLRTLVSAPLLDPRPYVVQEASTSILGTEVIFRVPAVPIAAVRATIPTLTRGSVGPRDRPPARSR